MSPRLASLTRSRRGLLVGVVIAAAAVSGCGGEREATPEQQPRLNLPRAAQPGENTTVGLLVSVDQSSMVLKSKKGFETFIIRNEDRPNLGLDHALSHAGSNVGFEVTYEPDPEEKDINYVLSARETLPPEGVTLEDSPAPPEAEDTPETPATPKGRERPSAPSASS